MLRPKQHSGQIGRNIFISFPLNTRIIYKLSNCKSEAFLNATFVRPNGTSDPSDIPVRIMNNVINITIL